VIQSADGRKPLRTKVDRLPVIYQPPRVLPRAPRKLRKRHVRGELRAVVDETVALFHRLRWVSEQIYGDEGVGAARRGILRGVARYGEQTVPELARTRSVTRQHVQEVVEALVAEGLVELRANPRHKRSKLVCATARGHALVLRMDEVDDRVLAAVGARLSTRDLAITAHTLEVVRKGFEVNTRVKLAASPRER
jgi:DNA-binding MarR family transcriptional regulator